MSYLIETTVVSELVKTRPHPKVTAWVSRTQEHLLYLSVLTLGELRKGIVKLQDRRRREKLERWLAEDLLPRFEERVLPVSTEVASKWGEIAGEAERRGASLPVIDALIGATALAHALTVVTRNTRDIERTGAKVLDPWSA